MSTNQIVCVSCGDNREPGDASMCRGCSIVEEGEASNNVPAPRLDLRLMIERFDGLPMILVTRPRRVST